MLRHSRGLSGQRVGLHYVLMCCWLTLLFFASPSFAQSTVGLKKTSQDTSIARQVQLEGQLEVLHEDYPDKTSRTRHFLRDASGKRYELKFKAHTPQHLRGGSKLRVKGSVSGNVMYLTTSDSTSIQQLSVPANNAIGVQKTAVILVNFQDNPVQTFTLADAQNMVFGKVNSFYLENSFQQTSFSGNVFGWYTLPMSTSTCDAGAIATNANNAATAAGVDLSSYTRFVYMFPSFVTSCGWAGLASVGATPSAAFINGYYNDLRVIAHELGHNLGLSHAHSRNCDPSPIGTSCTDWDYGDLEDTMGGTNAGHFNAYAKEVLGWLNASGTPPIANVQASGSYVLEPYSITGSGNKALKILRSTDATTGEQSWYYVEYRQPQGFDGVLANVGNLAKGISIRTVSASQGAFLLDMTPNSNTTADGFDMKDGALAVGASFTDPTAGVTISLTWANSSGAGIDVVLGGQTSCKRQAPSVLVSSAQSQAVAAGTPVTYTIAVTNNDSSVCGSSSFNLQKSLPAGWSGGMGASSLTIGAGSVASTTLTVTSPTTAIAGSYSIGGVASNSSSGSGSGLATYSIAPATTTSLAASVTTDKGIYKLGEVVTASATVMADGKPVANASVGFTLTKPNGTKVSQTVTTSSNGLAQYKYRLNKQKDSVGTYQVGAVVSNSGKTASNSTSFTAQ